MESLGKSLTDKGEPVPNLDDIINQITSNGEFKDMMSQLSDELSVPKTKNEPVNDQKESESVVSSECEDQMSQYDLLTTFFSDENGNNICDVLSNINNNLSKLVDRLPDKSQ